MRRGFAICTLVVCCSAALRADVTITMETTVDGPMATIAGGATPRLVLRIKGEKMRMDIDAMGQGLSTITDLTGRQVIVLMASQKTAQVFDPARLQAQVAGLTSIPTLPKIDGVFEPTGRTQMIADQLCEQFTFAMSMDLSQMSGVMPQMPKEATQMLAGAKMVTKGAVWVARAAPGAAEYLAFQKAALAANLMGASPVPGGVGPGSLDQMMRLFMRAEGITYLSEVNISIEGDAPIVEMLKQLATMKVTNKVTDVSLTPIADDLFVVPADYTVTKP